MSKKCLIIVPQRDLKEIKNQIISSKDIDTYIILSNDLKKKNKTKHKRKILSKKAPHPQINIKRRLKGFKINWQFWGIVLTIIGLILTILFGLLNFII